MKKYNFLLLLFCLSGIIILSGVIVSKLVNENNNSDGDFAADSLKDYNIRNILNTNEYDSEIILKKGIDSITVIAEGVDECAYWKDSEIINFEFLHSFQTGKTVYALFDILGTNGQYGYIIYDCVKDEANSFSASKSPYKLLGENENNVTMPDITGKETYLFYAPMSYGYGVLDENDRIDIYDINGILLVAAESMVITDAHFHAE